MNPAARAHPPPPDSITRVATEKSLAPFRGPARGPGLGRAGYGAGWISGSHLTGAFAMDTAVGRKAMRVRDRLPERERGGSRDEESCQVEFVRKSMAGWYRSQMDLLSASAPATCAPRTALATAGEQGRLRWSSSVSARSETMQPPLLRAHFTCKTPPVKQVALSVHLEGVDLAATRHYRSL